MSQMDTFLFDKKGNFLVDLNKHKFEILDVEEDIENERYCQAVYSNRGQKWNHTSFWYEVWSQLGCLKE